MKKSNVGVAVEIIIVIAAIVFLGYSVGYRKGVAAGKKEATKEILKLADQMLKDEETISPEEEVNRVVEEPNDLGSTNIQPLGDGQGS